MYSRTKIVERALGLKVPSQYAVFLETRGDFAARGIEVHGLTDDTVDMEKMPCVIGATKIYRRDEGLPHRFLVIQCTGIEDEIVCLDTEDGKVYAFSRMLGDRKVADSFDEWFQRDIIEYSKELEECAKQLDKEWE